MLFHRSDRKTQEVEFLYYVSFRNKRKFYVVIDQSFLPLTTLPRARYGIPILQSCRPTLLRSVSILLPHLGDWVTCTLMTFSPTCTALHSAPTLLSGQ